MQLPAGVEYLRMTPAGIMAPVGSEVVLKAGICGCDGNLVANRRVDWQLSGAGQFSELGTRHQVGYVHWPFDTPRKVDNTYAVSATSLMPTTLYRLNARSQRRRANRSRRRLGNRHVALRRNQRRNGLDARDCKLQPRELRPFTGSTRSGWCRPRLSLTRAGRTC